MSSETTYDNLFAQLANAKVVAGFPNSPYEYYGELSGKSPEELTWVGGELFYNTNDSRLYINSATSGQVATWYRLADTFATSTTSTTTTSTSTSTSTSSSTSTSTTTTTTSTTTTTTTTTSTSTSTSTTTTTSTSTSTTTTTSTSTSTTTSSTTTMP